MHLYHLITNFFVMDTISLKTMYLDTLYCVTKKQNFFSYK